MMNFYEAIECMKKGKYCICDYIKLKYPYMYIELVNNKEQEKNIIITSRKDKIPNSFPYLRAKMIDSNYVICELDEICKGSQDWYIVDKWGNRII